SMTNTSFSPAGITDDPEIRTASSLIDYIFRRLALTYLPFDDRLELGLASIDDMPTEQTSLPIESEKVEEKIEEPKPVVAKAAEVSKPTTQKTSTDTAPLCSTCGNITPRSGSCYVCTSCGTTSGCS